MQNIDASLDLYKMFCAVVRTKNMSVAAKELYVSQPAVSMAIRQLEEKFGKPLLVRSSKGIRTTPEGSMLYEYISKALKLIEAGEKKYFEMVKLEAGEIRIGASDTILSYYLLPFIEQYTQAYGAINIKVTNRITYETIGLLKSGSVDIGFVNLPIERDDGIEIIECMKIHDCLVGGPKFKDLSGISIRDINQYPLLLIEPDSNTRRCLDNYAGTYDILLTPNIELGSHDLLIEFAKINLGLTFAAREFILGYLENQALFEIQLEEPIPPRAIGMIKLRGAELPYAAQKFAEFLQIL